jgi:hypothetical protein
MDYIPPERPALIAQAKDEERRAVYKIIDTGQIDQMNELDDFTGGPTGIQWDSMRKNGGIKPGQYVELCHADDPSSKLTFYVQEHKPCSVPTYEAFSALMKLKPVRPSQPWLNDKQLGTISEILGAKLDKSKFDMNANVNDVGGRKVLSLTTVSKQKPTIVASAYYLLADAKNRVIEEVGYKNARKDDKYWRDEATRMLTSVKFIKEPRQSP